MSDTSRLAMLVELGLKREQGAALTDTQYDTCLTSSGQEKVCVKSIVGLLIEFYPRNLSQRREDILTWYQQSADFQAITRILSGLLSKKAGSDG